MQNDYFSMLSFQIVFIGFNLNKIHIEKHSENLKGLKINTNIDIPDMEIIDSPFKDKNVVLKATFEFSINYEPKIAEIKIRGITLLAADPKTAKNVINAVILSWDSVFLSLSLIYRSITLLLS